MCIRVGSRWIWGFQPFVFTAAAVNLRAVLCSIPLVDSLDYLDDDLILRFYLVRAFLTIFEHL